MISSPPRRPVHFPEFLVLMKWPVWCWKWGVKHFPVWDNLSFVLKIAGFKDLHMLLLSRTVQPEDGRHVGLWRTLQSWGLWLVGEMSTFGATARELDVAFKVASLPYFTGKLHSPWLDVAMYEELDEKGGYRFELGREPTAKHSCFSRSTERQLIFFQAQHCNLLKYGLQRKVLRFHYLRLVFHPWRNDCIPKTIQNETVEWVGPL